MVHGGASSVPSSPSTWRSNPYSYGRHSSSSSRERLVAIGLALVAILSPLFIDRRKSAAELEYESTMDIQSVVSTWLPLLLLGLMMAIALPLNRIFANFDRYWIHRFGGSSGGIITVLIVLALVLKCRACISTTET